MIRNIVVSVSLGTGFMLIAMVLLICLSIALDKVLPGSPLHRVDVYRSKTGAVGEVERTINDLKYGPVNLEAAKEVKNGGLLSRIIHRRQTRSANSCQSVPCEHPIATVTAERYEEAKAEMEKTMNFPFSKGQSIAPYFYQAILYERLGDHENAVTQLEFAQQQVQQEKHPPVSRILEYSILGKEAEEIVAGSGTK